MATPIVSFSTKPICCDSPRLGEQYPLPAYFLMKENEHSLLRGHGCPLSGNVAAYALDKLRLFIFTAFSALFLAGFQAFRTLTSIAFGFRSVFFPLISSWHISCHSGLWVTLDWPLSLFCFSFISFKLYHHHLYRPDLHICISILHPPIAFLPYRDQVTPKGSTNHQNSIQVLRLLQNGRYITRHITNCIKYFHLSCISHARPMQHHHSKRAHCTHHTGKTTEPVPSVDAPASDCSASVACLAPQTWTLQSFFSLIFGSVLSPFRC